ncbi:hypothetical protein B9N43_12505 [Denitratisoma sp. DHT3]|uniref:type III pantothenate kinase n=1 Tax=Denitratisoma sp. DHT3 TaxID=1981880 RepID=UPI0011985B8F|nr:type III pantothenate kinase [Denitratisoma sp. DHT3]QDX81997.1 hypothetical protein B9N43_12505 [Denitratisoma sp. DHT3]
MILCLDCGNTRIKWGLREGSDWCARGAFATTATLTTATVAELAAHLPADRMAAVTRVLGVNVAGPAVAAAIERGLGRSVQWLQASPHCCGVTNHYEQPAQLGADRWAALIGAWHLQQDACLVLSAGTATTIDVLDAGGGFQGGLILPGLDLMRSALARNTAQLPPQPGHYRMLPRNTQDAISSGALHATLGAIGRMYAHLAQMTAGPVPACLLSGGAAEALAPHLELPLRRVDNLALEGLAHLALAS